MMSTATTMTTAAPAGDMQLLDGLMLPPSSALATTTSDATTSASSGDDVCLCCEMDYVVSEVRGARSSARRRRRRRAPAQVYSGAQTPLSPHQFLYGVWKQSNTFAGYEQQDAHEFLIRVLNGVHAHCDVGAATAVSGAQLGALAHLTTSAPQCACVTHRVFGGLLRSDVTCRRCGQTSSTVDPVRRRLCGPLA